MDVHTARRRPNIDMDKSTNWEKNANGRKDGQNTNGQNNISLWDQGWMVGPNFFSFNISYILFLKYCGGH